MNATTNLSNDELYVRNTLGLSGDLADAFLQVFYASDVTNLTDLTDIEVWDLTDAAEAMIENAHF